MTNAWVRRPRADEPTWRLLCIPHAGAGAGALSAWFAQAPPGCEVVIARLPGRESRLLEAPVATANEAARGLLDSAPELFDRPFTLFGYSMGALVAYEATRLLHEAQRPMPDLLAVGGHEAPHLPRREAPIHDLADEQFVEALRDLGGTPDEVLNTPELFALLAPALRADLKLVETYESASHAALPVPIVTYTGQSDESLDQDAVLAWSQVSAVSTGHRTYPGGHFFLAAPTCALLADIATDSAAARTAAA